MRGDLRGDLREDLRGDLRRPHQQGEGGRYRGELGQVGEVEEKRPCNCPDQSLPPDIAKKKTKIIREFTDYKQKEPSSLPPEVQEVVSLQADHKYG